MAISLVLIHEDSWKLFLFITKSKSKLGRMDTDVCMQRKLVDTCSAVVIVTGLVVDDLI
jgi:hypothetical protein